MGMESRFSDCASAWRHALINVPADCVMLWAVNHLTTDRRLIAAKTLRLSP